MAAELIDAGVDVHDTYRRLYERVPVEKLKLVARALEKVARFDDGRLAVTYIAADDYRETGASEVLTEGIIDHIRALEGAAVAAMIRDRTDSGGAARKVSLRSTDGEVDVSAIARGHGGGGHPRAAGFGTDLPYEELIAVLRAEVAAQLGGSRRASCSPTSRPASPRTTSSPDSGGDGGPRAVTPAPSTRSPPAC